MSVCAKHMAPTSFERVWPPFCCVCMLLSIVVCAACAAIDIRMSGVGLLGALFEGASTWHWVAVANTVVIQFATVSMVMMSVAEFSGRVSQARMLARVAVVAIIVMALMCVVVNGFVWMLGCYVFQLVFVVAWQCARDPYLTSSVPWRGISVPARVKALVGSVTRTGVSSSAHMRVAKVVESPDGLEYSRGYMPLNVFNVVWLFFVGSVFGLVIETIWHLVFFGEWQDRAGLLWGPLSPIYGTGAVCLTVVLNRLWRANPVFIFLVSGISGSVVEYLTSLYLEAAVGVVAWDYTGTVGSIGGRTNLFFFVCWGVLGLLWVRVLLPVTMRVVDMVPLRMRAISTSVLFAFLLVDFSMTVVACDCWSKRHAGIAPKTDAEVFFAEHFDDEWMASRFQTMTFGDEAVHVQIEEESKGIRFV